MAMSVGSAQIHACNCMYGTQDARCCINKARQSELDRAYEAGRRGEPRPQPTGIRPIGTDKWVTEIIDGLGNAPYQVVDCDE